MFGQIKADYGIYWLKNSDQGAESAVPACRHSVGKARCMRILLSSGYFDPKKPTIIFFHGWQPGSAKINRVSIFAIGTKMIMVNPHRDIIR